MFRRIAAIASFGLAAALAAAAPGQSDPRPGTVVGLDVSSPESAATSFVNAWADGDYFVAWLTLDPALRGRFIEAHETFNYARIFGVAPGAAFFDRFKARLVDDAFSAETPAWSVDAFAQFEAMLRAGADVGTPLPRFDPGAMGDPVASRGGDASATLARVAVPPAAGGGVLVLRRSPSGLWRLVGVEKRDVPEVWLFRAD